MQLVSDDQTQIPPVLVLLVGIRWLDFSAVGYSASLWLVGLAVSWHLRNAKCIHLDRGEGADLGLRNDQDGPPTSCL